MNFSTVQFLFVFLPLAWLVYFVLPPRARNAALAAVSLLFCVWGGYGAAALLLAFCALNWLAGLALALAGRAKKPLLAAAVALDLAVLGFFKYAGFAAQNINALLPGAVPVVSIALPLGLSFYTFQGISYCVDVAKGETPPEKNPVRFFLYMAFFAHVTSGPIMRYGDQAAALDPQSPARKVTLDRFCYGIKRFVLGLAKKALLADQLGVFHSRVVSVSAGQVPAPVLLLGTVAYAFQLYYDFSGYSDMAVGLGEMFGLTMPENFDYPFLSRTVGEFWRRWHITLGAWFRRYLYFPLGGSRCSPARTCLNLFVVFLCTGIWHGAAWQFVAFGVWHGAWICAERLGLAKLLDKLPRWVSHVYFAAVSWVGFVLFGAPGLGQALAELAGVLTWQAGAAGMTAAAFFGVREALLLVTAIALCGPAQALLPRFKVWLREKTEPRPLGTAVLLALLFCSIVLVTANNYQGFIYAQF